MWKKVKCISTLIMKELKKKTKTQKYLTSTEKRVRLLTYICETLMILDYLGVSVLLCISTAQIESYYYQYNIFMYLLQNWNSCLDSVSLWSFVLIVSWSTVWAINEEVLLSLFLEWTYWYYLNLVNMLLKLTEMVQISISSLTYLLDTYLFLNCGSIFNILF